MGDIATIVHRYIDTWNETDAGRRRALIDEVFAPDASYIDPLVEAKGRDAIDQFVSAAQQQFAGLVFSLGGPIDAHHDQARFTWHLSAPGAAEPIAIGFDVAVADSGRLRQVYGFIDKAPAA
jgi:hypothetical protein